MKKLCQRFKNIKYIIKIRDAVASHLENMTMQFKFANIENELSQRKRFPIGMIPFSHKLPHTCFFLLRKKEAYTYLLIKCPKIATALNRMRTFVCASLYICEFSLFDTVGKIATCVFICSYQQPESQFG